MSNHCAFVQADLEKWGIHGETLGDNVWRRLSQISDDFHRVRAYTTHFDRGYKIEIGDPEHGARDSIRRQQVYIFHAPYLEDPARERMLVDLMVGACAHAGKAGHLTLFETWNEWYAQDKPDAGHREAVSSDVVIRGRRALGLEHEMYIEPHNPGAMEHGYDRIDLLYMAAFMAAHIAMSFELSNAVVGVSDAGSMSRSKYFAKYLGVPLVMLPKTREHDTPTEARGIGAAEDLTGKTVFNFDDMIRKGGTQLASAKAARSVGAERYVAVTPHLGLYDPDRLFGSELIDEIWGTNSNPLHPNGSKLKEVCIANLAAELIKRESRGDDVTYYMQSFAPSNPPDKRSSLP